MPLRGFWKKATPFLLLLPLIVWLVGFALIPMSYGLYLSLNRAFIENLANPTWAGLANYRALFKDPGWLRAIKFSLRFALISVSIQMVAGLAIAQLFNRHIPGKGVAIMFLLMPMVVSAALIGTMYRVLLNEFVGPIQYLLNPLTGGRALMGIRLVQWTVIALVCLIEIPFVFINTYAALQAVPQDLMEAADTDGATPWQRFWNVTFPLILPIVGITFLERVLGAFLVFALVYTLTGGGPGDATQSVSLYIYIKAFNSSNFGLANAAAFTLTAFLFLPALYTVSRMMRSLR